MDLETLLDSVPELPAKEAWREPGYEGTIDYRIRNLSYSSSLLLHTCPRKYQLTKVSETVRETTTDQSITFGFGHAVGYGVQASIQGKSLQEIFLTMFFAWPESPNQEHTTMKKMLWDAFLAVHKFRSTYLPKLQEDYELAYVNGIPAIELSFRISYPHGFKYRGHVDLVLRHKVNGTLLVVELKTTGLKVVSPGTYKNSSQALGYSVIIDYIDPNASSYEVLYIVFQTESAEFHTFPFIKTYTQRADWIRLTLDDIERIRKYEEDEWYPKHGESCRAWNRDCEFMNVCDMNPALLAKPCRPEHEDKVAYTIDIGIEELIESQLKKVS